eukprot:CAMPEP_0195519782 /NCGR_PEP_ID=MMETSP0794_2-20130614/15466_1 /TAXON_ID=515487 /ORGANISM="Stephanopyxis turris, Strain CCMP 815" /LENGTH=126 /DNA_ID=CAMNT_0040648995 /DNA_START=401 /DNA_END=781 /DNA_ORIENTATION=+
MAIQSSVEDKTAESLNTPSLPDSTDVSVSLEKQKVEDMTNCFIATSSESMENDIFSSFLDYVTEATEGDTEEAATTQTLKNVPKKSKAQLHNFKSIVFNLLLPFRKRFECGNHENNAIMLVQSKKE